METSNNEDNNLKNGFFNRMEVKQKRGKVTGGLILIGLGSIFLAKELGLLIPEWLLSWPVLLIVIGFYIGVKHQFQKNSWLVLVLLGFAFLLRNFFPIYDVSSYILPVILIIVGIYVLIKPKNNCYNNRMKWKYNDQQQ
jgi:predicted membrane protein